MIQTEVERIFSAKVNKNGGSLTITIPIEMVEDYEIESNDKVEFAYIKKLGFKSKIRKRR